MQVIRDVGNLPLALERTLRGVCHGACFPERGKEGKRGLWENV